ncbi:hypothetical protein DFH06DRAFT_1466031 [Mycena polygramma]|nr:hypothetical protein DFH06DRAFT_1466031 [Mycena polygramma]
MDDICGCCCLCTTCFALVAAAVRYIPFQAVFHCNCCRKRASEDEEDGQVDIDTMHFPPDANARNHFTPAEDSRANPYAAARPMHARAYSGAGDPGLQNGQGDGGYGNLNATGPTHPFERSPPRAPSSARLGAPSDYDHGNAGRDGQRDEHIGNRGATERESALPNPYPKPTHPVGRQLVDDEARPSR